MRISGFRIDMKSDDHQVYAQCNSSAETLKNNQLKIQSPDKYKSSGKKQSYNHHFIYSKKKEIHLYSSSSRGLHENSSSDSYDDEDGEDEYSSSGSMDS